MTSATLSGALVPPTLLKSDVVARALRVPLLGKIIGANVLLVAAAVATHFLLPPGSTPVQLAILFAVSFAATTGLVWLALRPIAEIEETAQRVSDGDFSVRVPASKLADRDAARLSSTMNRLLDRVEADRARIQYLAGRAVRARDIERASVARELRDSFAQTVAGVGMQLATLERSCTDASARPVLQQAQTLVRQLNEDMRIVADTLYPGTLLEFGLDNALRALARRLERRGDCADAFNTLEFPGERSPPAANALYRVADEALRNAEQHARAKHVSITLSSDTDALLEIEDDGKGFDLRATDPLQAGLGLFSAQSVLALAGGSLQISSANGRGTRISARVPVALTTHVLT